LLRFAYPANISYIMTKNPLLSCSHIAYSIKEHEILHDVSFSVFPGEVMALVGPNGVGKSTLLKIIAQKYSNDIDTAYDSFEGKIEISPKKIIAYFPQEIPLTLKNTKVKEYVEQIDQKLLKELGLDQNILEKKLGELSGGEKSKINLLKIKMIKADIYILDEPTNNLDSRGIEHLESIMKDSKDKAFIIISHDRQLLENFADKIVEIDWHTRNSFIYPGPFSTYMELRKQRIENEWQRYIEYLDKKDSLKHALQEKKQWSVQGEKGPKKTDNEKLAAGNMKDWSGKILGKSVKNAQKKIEELEVIERPKEILSISYPIPMDDRSGDLVFELKNVQIKRGLKNIGPLSLKIQFGDRLIILGDNGSGKTTLIKMVLGKLAPDKGEVQMGSRIITGYLPQESELDDNQIINMIKDLDQDKETDFRKLLNNFGITKEEMRKNGKDLSPGERSRFALASIIAQRPNCLILDEPTNHLDIFALDFLEEALSTYKGTVIIISHDRYFLSRLGEYKVFDFNKILI